MSPLLPDILTLEVFPDFPLSSLKALIAEEAPVLPADQQYIYLAGHLLSDDAKTLSDHGISDNEMLMVHTRKSLSEMQKANRPEQAGASTIAGGSGGRNAGQDTQHGSFNADAELIRLRVLGNQEMMSQLREQQPQLADAVNDPQRFSQIFKLMEDQRQNDELEKQREIQRLNDDPFSIESQSRIEELIRQERVRENLQNALEYNPESFGRVTMLYIPTEVNGHPVKAFVDSGAQATIMSPSCAEACGIMRLVDSRFAGVAHGVGTAKILGRVHSAQIRIGKLFLPCSFTVMEGKDVDLLLGLDMLKRHQACINLRTSCLEIGDEAISFLGESDLPAGFGDAPPGESHEPVVEGPSGSLLGGHTGAIVKPPGETDHAFAGPGHTLGTSGSTSTSAAPQPTTNQPQTILSPTTIPPPGSTTINPPSLPSGRQTEFSGEMIAQLTSLGFTEAEAIQALRATNGNVELAASLLFQ